MDAADLETYQVHLSQTEQALTADPGNEQLTELASELKQLIELTKVAVGQSEAEKAKSEKKAAAAAASSSAAAAQSRGAKAWGAGDECLAKYSGDDKWYPARITAVGGGESVCAAAGQHDRVRGLHRVRRIEQVGLAGARATTADVDGDHRHAVAFPGHPHDGGSGGPLRFLDPVMVADGDTTDVGDAITGAARHHRLVIRVSTSRSCITVSQW